MKTLVIGGNRFFGKRLVHDLLNRGLDVTVMNRGSRDDGFADRVKRITLDRRELRRNDKALGTQSWDFVFDQVCYEAPEAERACETFEGRVGHYVFTSSRSVYGPKPGVVEEDFDPLKHRFDNVANKDTEYAEAKRQCEAVFFQQAKFPLTAVRFPIVLGEDDYTERLKFHVDRVMSGLPIYFPNPDAKISFVRSKDASDFLGWLVPEKGDAASTAMGPINVCSEEPVTLRWIVETVEKVTGKTAHLASSSETGEGSPFGIDDDWHVNIDKLKRAYASRGTPLPAPVAQWLPELAGTYLR